LWAFLTQSFAEYFLGSEFFNNDKAITLIGSLDVEFRPWACKSGSVVGDGGVFSRAASLVFRFRAAILGRKPFFESLDR
jgi:hypothetical protein